MFTCQVHPISADVSSVGYSKTLIRIPLMLKKIGLNNGEWSLFQNEIQSKARKPACVYVVFLTKLS